MIVRNLGEKKLPLQIFAIEIFPSKCIFLITLFFFDGIMTNKLSSYVFFFFFFLFFLVNKLLVTIFFVVKRHLKFFDKKEVVKYCAS